MAKKIAEPSVRALAAVIVAARERAGLSQEACATSLGVAGGHLCDVEKGRRWLSPSRAARWAALLGEEPARWVELALQDQLDRDGPHGLRIKVEETTDAPA